MLIYCNSLCVNFVCESSLSDSRYRNIKIITASFGSRLDRSLKIKRCIPKSKLALNCNGRD